MATARTNLQQQQEQTYGNSKRLNSKQAISGYNKTPRHALVNIFWTRLNGYILDNGDKRKTFVCRLSKPKESSRRKENLPSEKLCITWKRDAVNFEAKIKITWLAASNMVTIERVNGASDHSYLIEESDMHKWSKFIRDMVGNEAIKNYKPLTIANVVRKE
ncbi:18027_t:CDS:2, partial [Racocetra persica]